MANFDILYPAKERQGFDGGLNDKFEKHLIADNESPDCQNVIFNDRSVETRPGVTKFNNASVGSFTGDGIYTRNDRAGTQTMVAFWNGAAYYNSNTTFVTIPSAQSVFTAGRRIAAAEYENYIFFGNGGQISYKYNGDFTRHGTYPPTQTMSVASNATGSVTGQYLYKLTYVNSALVESDLGPVTATFTAASATVRISNIPTAAASYGVSTRRLYRTKNNSFATYFRVGTIADNTTTTFDDNVLDTALGVAAPDDQGIPPNYSAIITHQNRLFCNDPANPNFVWYSEIDTPYVFKAENFVIVGNDAGDLVRGLAIHDNSLVVTTNESVFVIYMPDPDPVNWVVVKLRSSYGGKSPHGFFSYNNKVMFPAMQNSKLVGFAAISGNTIEPDATLLTVSAAGSDMKSQRIEPDVFLIQESYIDRISSMVYQNRAFITVTYGNAETLNNRIYVFDFSISNLSKQQEASWVPWTGLNAEQFTIYSGNIYYQSSIANGTVYKLLADGVYSDDGVAIDSYFYTKYFSGVPGDEQTFKDFRYANLLYEKSGGYFMDLTYRTDSDGGVGTTIQVDLDPGGSLWGVAVWGTDLWGGGNEDGEERLFLGQMRGKRIQFRFSNQNTVNQKFKINGMQFSYNRKGRR